MQNENGCWNCVRARDIRDSRIWCPYWQAYFSMDYTDCEPPAFIPLVMSTLNAVPDVQIW
ncbi:MAG: hypothetical protein ACFFGZ_09105 [Candidatus Thorarchaeota archaeon]